MQAGGVFVHGGDNEEFVDGGVGNKILQASADGVRGADEGVGEHGLGVGFFGGVPIGFDVVDGRLEFARSAAKEVGELLLGGGEQSQRLAIGVRGEDIDSGRGIRAIDLL